MIVYVAAVTLWLGAVATLGISTVGFLQSTGLLVASAVLSGLAVVASVSALVLARRR